MAHRVLIIDDDEFVREILIRHCRMLGLDVSSASTGEDGLQILAREPIDLVITDIHMPGMNGEAVVRHIKQTSSLASIPVLVVSGYADTDAVVRCIELGAEDILHKPFEALVLQARIKSCLEHRELRQIAMRAAEEKARENATAAVIGGLCHHFSQPLTVMTANLHMIRESIRRFRILEQTVSHDGAETRKPLLSVIDESATSMREALDQISLLVREVSSVIHPVSESYLQDNSIVNFRESAKQAILLATPERLARTLYSRKLSLEGYRVIEATTPEDLREHMGCAHPDLAVLDMRMEGVDTFALNRLAGQLPFPVILFAPPSPHGGKLPPSEWLDSGDGFVADLTPASIGTLLECCATALQTNQKCTVSPGK